MQRRGMAREPNAMQECCMCGAPLAPRPDRCDHAWYACADCAEAHSRRIRETHHQMCEWERRIAERCHTTMKTPVLYALFASLALASCSSLSPEQKAEIERRAIAAGIAAGTAAAQAVKDGKKGKDIAEAAATAALGAVTQAELEVKP